LKISYDPIYNIAYICFHNKPTEVETIKVSDELNVDLLPDGTIYGIELLNANEQLKDLKECNLVIINEATGKKLEVPISHIIL
jgi:uncharacterized protein YuzE